MNFFEEMKIFALTGKAEVNWVGSTPSLAALDGGKTIEVACSKTLSTSIPAEFFLFAPAGSMEGLTLTVNFQEEAAHFKPFTRITRNSTLNLERNKVLPIAWAVNGYNTGVSAKGEPIAVEGGKVLFFVDIPAEGSAIRDALGYTGNSFSGYSVYVNGTQYDVLTNKGGETYIEVDENPGGTYEAYLVKGESLGLYGATADVDVVLPFSQFITGTKADFENYPRYAKYDVSTGQSQYGRGCQISFCKSSCVGRRDPERSRRLFLCIGCICSQGIAYGSRYQLHQQW